MFGVVELTEQEKEEKIERERINKAEQEKEKQAREKQAREKKEKQAEQEREKKEKHAEQERIYKLTLAAIDKYEFEKSKAEREYITHLSDSDLTDYIVNKYLNDTKQKLISKREYESLCDW